MSFLRIDGLTIEGRSPDGHWLPTVHDVSLTLEAGEVLALIGGSGAGKTTVALAAMGYTRPGTRITRGSVAIEGINLLQLSPRRLRGLRGSQLAYVAQSAQSALNPAIRLGEQVEEPFLIHHIAPPGGATARVTELLGQLDIPSPASIGKRFPHQISGGQQQRIMLAMGLTCDPGLLVLDEPTTALDVTTQIEVLRVIKSALRRNRSAAIYVSHDLALVAQLADRVIVMQSGHIVEQGATADIIHQPQSPYTRELVDAFTPRKPLVPGTRNHVSQSAPLLEVQAVSASYGKAGLFSRQAAPANVLHEVSFKIDPGQIVAVIGESGSGKSTLGRVIAGLHPANHGVVNFRGQALAKLVRQRSDLTQRGIQIVLQSPDLSLNPRQRVRQAIGRPLELYHRLSRSAKTARIAELLELVGLPALFSEKFPGELSGGQRQRVSIARAFAANPDLIICDEITSSLDGLVATQVLDLIHALRAKSDVSYLFISHDMKTVGRIADLVIVMYGGRICEIGRPAEVLKTPRHPYTALLLASVPTLDLGWIEAVAQKDREAGHQPPPQGCVFFARCQVAIAGLCDTVPPPARSVAADHAAYCHLVDPCVADSCVAESKSSAAGMLPA